MACLLILVDKTLDMLLGRTLSLLVLFECHQRLFGPFFDDPEGIVVEHKSIVTDVVLQLLGLGLIELLLTMVLKVLDLSLHLMVSLLESHFHHVNLLVS